MSKTIFLDLPDLVILKILHYLTAFEALQAFYDIENRTDRFAELLIERQCFSSMHQLRFPFFEFICRDVLPRIGSKLDNLTLNYHQLALARAFDILTFLPNLCSLNLNQISDINEENNVLDYFLRSQIENLQIEFICEHRFDAQNFFIEEFLFNQREKALRSCLITNRYGIRLRRLDLYPNKSIEELNIQLKDLFDLHVLLENLPMVKTLHVQIMNWSVEEMNYDYENLSTKLRFLDEFSLKSEHALSFEQILALLRGLKQIKKFLLIYRNYDENGIKVEDFENVLSTMPNLNYLDLIIKFVFFKLNSKLTFDYFHSLKQKWNIKTYLNRLCKTYMAFTETSRPLSCSFTTDFFFENDLKQFSNVKKLHLNTHIRQDSLIPLMFILNSNFQSLTHFQFTDSFGTSNENDFDDIKLSKINSFDAIEITQDRVFQILYQSMINLNELHINGHLLFQSNISKLLKNNQIKILEIMTNNFDEIKNILQCFHYLEQLIVNTRTQSTANRRTYYHIVLDWFTYCSHLYTIHVKAHRLPDLFYGTCLENDPTVHVQYSIELFTLWR